MGRLPVTVASPGASEQLQKWSRKSAAQWEDTPQAKDPARRPQGLRLHCSRCQRCPSKTGLGGALACGALAVSTLSCWHRAGAPAEACPPPGLWLRPRFRVLANDGHLKARLGLRPPPGSADRRQDSGSWPCKPPHHVCLSPLCLIVSVWPHEVEAPGQGEASLSEPDLRGEATAVLLRSESQALCSSGGALTG